MANLPESPVFDAGVYQLETTDPVIGGPNGTSNAPLKNLANRTCYLKQQVEAAQDGLTVHLAATDPHPQYASDADLVGHVAAVDPHPVYLTGAEVDAKIAAALATGHVMFFTAATPPTGYLKANGAAVNRTAYAALFAAIGTAFGGGDGSTTFNLPDLRGEFIRGWDDGRGVDAGRTFGGYQADNFRSHTHTDNTFGNVSPNALWINSGSAYGNSYTTITGATGGTETRPRNVALLACIKY